MQLQRHHAVGLAAGAPLFSGAWLSAFYNNPWPGIVGLAITLVGLYLANRVEIRRDRTEHIVRGFVAGLMAGAAARVLGLIAGWIGGVSGFTGFANVDDTFRVVLAGDLPATIVFIALVGVLGAVVGLLEPEAAEPEPTPAKKATVTRKKRS